MNYNTITINLTAITTNEPMVDVPCNNCTLCCQKLSPYLTPDEITSGQYPISLIKPESHEPGPKVVLFRNSDGGCSMLINDKCSIYENRPLACKQFDCRKNHHPAIPDMTQ